MKPKYDLCFVGLKCHDLLVGKPVPRYLGGIEKQLVTLAKGFSAGAYKIAFITYDHGQKDGLDVNGIRVFKSFNPDEGLPVLRFIHPRTTKLWGAMKRADARIYIQMGAGVETGQVALWTNILSGKKRYFIYFAASNMDCDITLPQLKHKRERMLYRYGLRHADRIVSQTINQQNMLENSFGLKSKFIPMPSDDMCGRNSLRENLSFDNVGVLWVGRIVDIKRLEIFFDVAETCPNIEFHVVGTPNADSEYFNTLMKRGESIPNVKMHGRVSDARLADLYSNAFILCCTSVVEGFPTTFLEAWSYGVPVVTTFDPDDIVRNNNLGYIASDGRELAECIKKLISDTGTWRALSDNSKRYFQDNYSFSAIMPRYAGLFEELFNRA